MNEKIRYIQKYLVRKNYSFYLVTNSDMHLNENPNLNQKDIYCLTNFDCSNGFLLILQKKSLFFTDSRYTLAAEKHFNSKCNIYDLKYYSITDYIVKLGHGIKGLIDSKLISINEINNLKKKLCEFDIKFIFNSKNIFNKNYFPKFNTSYPFSLPKYCAPKSYIDNIKWIRSKLNFDGILIWNNSHIAYLLNIRSFEIINSTKPFAGLYISKQTSKPILISKNKYLKQIKKINENFYIFSQHKFINHIKNKKIRSIELQFKYTNYDIYLLLNKYFHINETKIDFDKRISQKTKTEFENIRLCHIQDGLSLTRFILKIKNKKGIFTDELNISEKLYQLRKEGVNFFRNSFDYISAFDDNASIVHYKPTQKKSKKIFNQSILLLDSGGHYLEGTTDVTRVIKINKLKYNNIKINYTYLLKSLIMIENSFFPIGITGSDLDNIIREYLLNFKIVYGHGTGHGVGYFNDVHEKYPIIAPNSKHKILNNNLFSIEPGFYMPNKFGLRLENLYFSRVYQQKIKLINVTLVPYELSLIDWKLITKKEKQFIKNYHKNIFNIFQNYLNDSEKNQFIDSLIDKI